MVLIVIFVISGYGLRGGIKKTNHILCFIVFILALALSIYFVGYAGEQGAIGIIFVFFGVGASCLIINVILWLVQLMKSK